MTSLTFKGSWAADLRRDYLEYHDQYWRAAIADGKISEREYDEVRNRSIQCMRDAGLTDARTVEDGYISYTDIPSIPQEEQHAIGTGSGKSSGLYQLENCYTQLRAIPDILDWQAGE